MESYHTGNSLVYGAVKLLLREAMPEVLQRQDQSTQVEAFELKPDIPACLEALANTLCKTMKGFGR